MKYILVLLSLPVLLNTAIARQTEPKIKNIKTEVLIIGGETAGLGAGIQSARAGMKTLIIEPTDQLGADLDKIDTAFKAGLNGEYLRGLKAGKTRDEILKHWTDTVKNLKVRLNKQITAVLKTPKGWTLTLDNNDLIETVSIVELKKEAYADYKKTRNWPDVAIQSSLYDNLARTAVGVNLRQEVMGYFALNRFIDSSRENIITLPSAWGAGDFVIGQVAGSIAALNVLHPVKDINIREVQQVMLQAGSRLIDFYDHDLNSPHFQIFQRIGVTGILPPMEINYSERYLPNGIVDIKNIKTGFAAYYPKSLFWFENHTAGPMNISDVLELFRYTTNQGEALNLKVQAEWQNKLGLTTPFDMDRRITRREFAVLLDAYLKPFDAGVNIEGKLIR